MNRMVNPPALVLVGALVATACTSKGGTNGTQPSLETMEIASYELVTNEPNRLLVGLVAKDGVVSYGTAQMKFFYLGKENDASVPKAQVGEPVSAEFVLVPEENQPVPSDEEMAQARQRNPEVTDIAKVRGVYEATGVIFDKPGFWLVEASVELGGRRQAVTGTFAVRNKPAYPAPGEEAPRSDNLTVADHNDAALTAVDSRANDGKLPDPQLHKATVADALAKHQVTVVVVSTPVYCQSRFCGPITDEIADVATDYGDRAAFIHLEVWRDFQKKVVNKAAAQWVYRGNNLTEPWIFLIGADGKIVDRWQNVVDRDQLEEELTRLTEPA